MAAGEMPFKIKRIEQYNPLKETVNTLQKRVPQFRKKIPSLPVTNEIQSCCWSPPAMHDYLEEHLTFLTDAKWKFKFASSSRLDLERAWIRPTLLKFWAIEECDNIGRAYVFRFDDCSSSELQKVQFGHPAEILGLGFNFRDGDLCYCFREEPSNLVVYELFYVETITGKTGFVEYGIHKWVPSDLNDWKISISNLVGKFYPHEEPGSSTEYSCNFAI